MLYDIAWKLVLI